MVKASIPSTAKAFPKTLKQFAASLEAEEAAPLTVKNYLLDLSQFAVWFQGTNGEPLTVSAITPTDIREYKAYLLTSAQAKPATVNRRLAALRKLCRFARKKGLLTDDPTHDVKSVERVKQAPKALDKKELNALMRAVERYGSVRDQAIILALRHSGMRVGELAQLKLSDLALGERKGLLTIRSGKGNKWRELRRVLRPGGALMLVDSRPFRGEPPAVELKQQRRLNDGSAHQIVKIYHTPETLRALLAPHGANIHTWDTGTFFTAGTLAMVSPVTA